MEDRPADWANMGVYKQELYKYIYDFIGNDAAATDAKAAILSKIEDASFVLDHATVSKLEPKDAMGQNRSEQVLGLLCAEFGGAVTQDPAQDPAQDPPKDPAEDPTGGMNQDPTGGMNQDPSGGMNNHNEGIERVVEDAAVVTVLTPIKNSLSDLCDGAKCEVDATLAGKTGMAKAYKFILGAIVDMGESADFDETTTIDNELVIAYNYNTDGATDPSGLHDFTRENLFDEAGPAGTPIFSFANISGEAAKTQMTTNFNAAMRSAEGYNMDQQLMYDFITAPVLDLTQYQIDMALQAMTDMPESVGGDFATNLNYVFNNLRARDANSEPTLMSDQEVQDLASAMTDSALGRNALCVATHVNSLQSIGTSNGADPDTLYASFDAERWTWRDMYKTPCNRFRSGNDL